MTRPLDVRPRPQGMTDLLRVEHPYPEMIGHRPAEHLYLGTIDLHLVEHRYLEMIGPHHLAEDGMMIHHRDRRQDVGGIAVPRQGDVR